MVNIKKILKQKIKSIINQWNEDGIYAVSFFVESNETYEYRGFKNITHFMVSYNTESDCEGAGCYDEERWNYAFWRQNEFPIIYSDEQNEITDLLFEWYDENGITDIGAETDDDYDTDYNYIGKGPAGHYELLMLVSDIAKELQDEGFIFQKFEMKLPIIVHGLEYAWYDIEATKNANPDGEADTFLKACKELGMC